MTTPRPGSLLTRIPALLGLLALAVFAALSLSTNAATRFYQWPWFFYWQVLLVAPIAILAFRLVRGVRLARFGGWLDGGLVLLAATNVVAAIFSPYRPQSLNAALVPVATVSVAYLGLDWIQGTPARRDDRIALLARVTGLLMALFVAVSLGLWLFARVLPAWEAGESLSAALAIRNEDPFGHSVYTAGFAILCAPWLAGLGLTAARRWRRPWFFAAALAVVLVPTTSSRGGVLALVTMLVCASAIWLARSPLSRGRRLLVVTGVLLAAGVFIGVNPRLRDLVVHRAWSDSASDSNRQRAAMLQAGVLMGGERPVTGFGPGTVSLVYPRYRARLSGGVDSVLQLHNTPVQLWAEFGAGGVAALVLLLIGILRLTWETQGSRAATGDPGQQSLPASRFRVLAAFVAFAGYAVISLFDYQLDIPLFAATAAALLVAWRASSPGPANAPVLSVASSRAARLLGASLLAALGVMLWPTLPNLRARQLFSAAADAREAGDNAAFVAGAEQAANVAPWEPFYLTQLAAFYGDEYLQAGTPEEKTRASDQCGALLRRALQIDSDQEYCHFNLAWLLLNGEPEEAEKHFRAAARLSPYRGGVYLGIGLSLLPRNEDPAVSLFALEWLNDPQALTSPRWEAPPLSPLRRRVAETFHRLTDRVLAQTTLPTASRDQVSYIAALADWWLGRSADTTALVRFGSSEQRRFFQSLATVEKRTFIPAASRVLEPWAPLYLAWRDGTPPPGFADDEPAATAAFRQRLAETQNSFARMLTGPPGPEAALIQYGRNDRPGHGVLQRNQDGFLLRDLYVYPENLLVKRYASFLFPPKGYLPDRFLFEFSN